MRASRTKLETALSQLRNVRVHDAGSRTALAAGKQDVRDAIAAIAAEEEEAAPAPTSPASGSVLFNGGFEAGFKGWYVQSLSGRATLVPNGSGGQAARFEVQSGDVEPDTGHERSEVSGPTFKEGQELYIRDAIRIPAASTFQGPWQIIQQLHETNWNSSPGLALFLDASNALTLKAGDGVPMFWKGSPLARDRWYDLIYRVKLSRDPSVGEVEVWLDGTNPGVSKGQTIQAPQTYLKAGIYRSKSSTGTSIVEHDSIVVGTSYDAVAGA